jgi:hypothetical protein
LLRRSNEEYQQIQKMATPLLRPPEVKHIESLCGVVVKTTLVQYTDGIIDHARRLIPSVMEAALALRQALLSKYPHRTIIQFGAEPLATETVQDSA